MVGLLMVVTCTPDVPEKKKSVETEVKYFSIKRLTKL